MYAHHEESVSPFSSSESIEQLELNLGLDQEQWPSVGSYAQTDSHAAPLEVSMPAKAWLGYCLLDGVP